MQSNEPFPNDARSARPVPVAWLLAALAAAIAVVNGRALLSPHLFEWGDLALGALQIDAARHGAELLGPYSRFGFHHPGPVSFYWLAFSEPLFQWIPTPLGRHLVAQLLLNFLLLGLLYRESRRVLESSLPALLLVLAVTANVLVLAGGAPPLLWEVWGPSQVVLPLVLFVVAAGRLARGRWNAAFPCALGAVLAVHNHLGTLAVIPPLTLAGAIHLVALARRGRLAAPDRTERRGLLLAGGFLVVTSAPILVEQFTADQGNLTKIALFLRETPRGDHGLFAAFAAVAPSFTDFLIVLARPLAPVAASPWGQLAVMALLAAAEVAQYRRGGSGSRALIVLLWVALPCCVAGAYLVKGALEPYLFRYAWGLAGIHFFLAGREAWLRWSGRLPGVVRFVQRRPALVAGLATALLIAWLPFHTVPAPEKDPRPARFLAALHHDPALPMMLHVDPAPPDGSLWIEAAGLNLALVRAGHRVRVEPGWQALYTDRVRARAGEEVQRAVLTRTRPTAGDAIDLDGFYVVPPE